MLKFSRACSTIPPSGNQVDGLPLVAHDSQSSPASLKKLSSKNNNGGEEVGVNQEANIYGHGGPSNMMCSGSYCQILMIVKNKLA